MSKYILSIFLSFFITIFIAFTTYKTYTLSLEYDKEMFEKAQLLKVENKLDSYLNNISVNILTTISQYLSNKSIDNKQTNKEIDNSTCRDDMQDYLLLYFLGIIALMITYFISSKEVFILSLLSASLLSWLVGILAPIMTIEIYSELPVLGFSVFKYDSKSIYTTIERLWLLQNYFVALMVGVFSIVIPLVKTIALYFSTFMKRDIRFIEFIGKWAMADVFVVALLITNLSLNADEFTNAKVQVAIYFFCSYVMLSMIASFLIKQNLKKEAIS